MAYKKYPGVDENDNFPPPIRAAFAKSQEFREGLTGPVAEAIANDDTVVQAIDNTIQNRSFAEMPEVVDNDEAIFSVTDEDGRRTWLEVAPDGGPTEHTKDKLAPILSSSGLAEMSTAVTGLSFAVVDEDGRRTWIEADANGKPTPRTSDLIADSMGLAGVQFTSGPAITCSGDSLTAGAGGTPYPQTLATLTGLPVHNLGVGGESSRTIAGRLGGRPYIATVANSEIPASGAVNVVLTADNGEAVAPLLQNDGTGTKGTNPVSISGIVGTLKVVNPNDAATRYYTFTRATDGDPVTVARPVPVLTDARSTRLGDVQVMWWGQNDGVNDATEIIGRQRATIEELTALNKRWLVLGLSSSTAAYRAPMEAQFLREYGRRFINLRAWLSTSAAMAEEGLTPTTTDLEDIARGDVPTSMRIDPVHLNTAGYNQVAKAVYNRLLEMGWI